MTDVLSFVDSKAATGQTELVLSLFFAPSRSQLLKASSFD
jgi:hypothetical protein